MRTDNQKYPDQHQLLSKFLFYISLTVSRFMGTSYKQKCRAMKSHAVKLLAHSFYADVNA